MFDDCERRLPEIASIFMTGSSHRGGLLQATNLQSANEIRAESLPAQLLGGLSQADRRGMRLRQARDQRRQQPGPQHLSICSDCPPPALLRLLRPQTETMCRGLSIAIAEELLAPAGLKLGPTRLQLRL